MLQLPVQFICHNGQCGYITVQETLATNSLMAGVDLDFCGGRGGGGGVDSNQPSYFKKLRVSMRYGEIFHEPKVSALMSVLQSTPLTKHNITCH